MEEIWLPIKGYEGLYEVSNLGNVRSLNYKRSGKIGNIIKNIDKKGYVFVTLYKNGKHKSHKVHRLVAEAFIPNWFNEPQINHKDENPKNNNVDNLEWCDCSYNINYGTRNYKVSSSLSKIVLQFTLDGEFIREWNTSKELKINGFQQSAISRCCCGERKFHKGYIWKYKEVV